MKRMLSIVLLFCVAVFICSCQKIESGQSVQPEVEIDRQSDIVYETAGNYIFFKTADELYDASSYVVLATPATPFEESEQIWKKGNSVVEKFEDASTVYSYTKRVFNIEKVYKGDEKDLKQITVGEHIISNGTDIKNTKALEGEYTAKVGEKYLLFLNKSNVKDLYFTFRKQGKYVIGEDKNEQNKQIDQAVFESVKEKYPELFK